VAAAVAAWWHLSCNIVTAGKKNNQPEVAAAVVAWLQS